MKYYSLSFETMFDILAAGFRPGYLLCKNGNLLLIVSGTHGVVVGNLCLCWFSWCSETGWSTWLLVRWDACLDELIQSGDDTISPSTKLLWHWKLRDCLWRDCSWSWVECSWKERRTWCVVLHAQEEKPCHDGVRPVGCGCEVV